MITIVETSRCEYIEKAYYISYEEYFRGLNRELEDMSKAFETEFEVCPICRGTSYNFINPYNKYCNNCFRGVREVKDWVMKITGGSIKFRDWLEGIKEDIESYCQNLMKYLNNNPEEIPIYHREEIQHARVMREDYFFNIVLYLEAFPEYKDTLIQYYPDWWAWFQTANLGRPNENTGKA